MDKQVVKKIITEILLVLACCLQVQAHGIDSISAKKIMARADSIYEKLPDSCRDSLKDADEMLDIADAYSRMKYGDNYVLWACNAGQTYSLVNDARIIKNRYEMQVSTDFIFDVQTRLSTFWRSRTNRLRESSRNVGRFDIDERWQEVANYYNSNYLSSIQDKLIAFAKSHEIKPTDAEEEALVDSFLYCYIEYGTSNLLSHYALTQEKRFMQSAYNLQEYIGEKLGKKHILYAVATCHVAMVLSFHRESEEAAMLLYEEAANIFHENNDSLAMRLALYSASHIYNEQATRQLWKKDSVAALSIKEREYAHIINLMGEDALIAQIIADERQVMGAPKLTSTERKRAEEVWMEVKRKRDPNADVFAEGVRLAHAKKYDEAIQTFIRCDSLDRISLAFGREDFRRQYTHQWILWCYIMNGQADNAWKWYSCKDVHIPSPFGLTDLCSVQAAFGLPPIDRAKTSEIDYYVNIEECNHLGYEDIFENLHRVRRNYLQKACAILGSNSLEYARILAHSSRFREGSPEEVLDSLNRAQSVFNAHLGQNDFVDVYMIERRADILHDLGYIYEANKSLEQALKIYSSKYGIRSLLYHDLVNKIINVNNKDLDTDAKLDLARWQLHSYEYNPSLTLDDRLNLLYHAANNFSIQNDNIDGMHPYEKAAQLYSTEVALCRQHHVEEKYSNLTEHSTEDDSVSTKQRLYVNYCIARTSLAYSNYIVQRIKRQPVTAIDSLKAHIADIECVLKIMAPESHNWWSEDLYKIPLEQKRSALHALAMLLNHSQLHSDVIATTDQIIEILHQIRDNKADTIPYLKLKAQSLVAIGQQTVADEIWRYTIDSIERYESHLEKANYYYEEEVEKNDDAFQNYAHILQSIGKPQQAAEYMSRYLDRVTPRILNGLIVENALNREKYWKEKGTLFERELPLFAYHNGNPSIIGQLYDAVLLSKGLLLNTDMEIRRMLMENGDSILISSYTQWLADQQVLAQQLRRPVQERTINTDSLSLRLKARQQQIFSTTSRKNQKDIVQNLHTSWQDIQQQLQPNDLAVEFLTVPVNRDSLLYVALTLRYDYTAPRMTPLCLQKEIQQIPSDLVYSTDTLYRLLWKPLEAELDNAHRVYFAPAGQLHQIGIEYLHGIQSERFIRLSSTRELVRPHLSPKIEAALYGGILYELTDQQRRQMTSQPSKSSLYLMRDVAIKRDLRGAEQEIPILPGSLHEVQSISHILKQHHAKAITVSGLEGTEASFKALSEQKKTLIHLSTHGFYLPQSSSRQETGSEGILLQGSEGAQTFEEQTLKRSGLLMTGAADFIYGQIDTNNKEDGILTAEEISQMNLQGLDLVVLSACETALGDITGDGVFGLQRGFKKAGAQSILMSLWKVDDEATCLLMTEFYKNWIGEGKTKHDALELAKQAVRSHKEKGWDDPKYWAAFILLDALD